MLYLVAMRKRDGTTYYRSTHTLPVDIGRDTQVWVTTPGGWEPLFRCTPNRVLTMEDYEGPLKAHC